MNKTLLLALFASVLVFAGCTKTTTPTPTGTGDAAATAPTADAQDYTAFATCLTNNKLRMYGTEWCGHCKNQKAMFGAAFANADYIDCDKERQACIDAGVQGFPTWIDAAGNKYPGTQSLEKLGQVAGCAMDGTSTAAPAAEAPAADTGTADTGATAPAAETGAATTGA